MEVNRVMFRFMKAAVYLSLIIASVLLVFSSSWITCFFFSEYEKCHWEFHYQLEWFKKLAAALRSQIYIFHV